MTTKFYVNAETFDIVGTAPIAQAMPWDEMDGFFSVIAENVPAYSSAMGYFYSPTERAIMQQPPYPGIYGDDSAVYRFDIFLGEWVLVPPPEPEVVPPPTVGDVELSQFRETDLYKAVLTKIPDAYTRVTLDAVVAHLCGDKEDVKALFTQLGQMVSTSQ